MVQVQELVGKGAGRMDAEDAEYEDVSDEYTDSDELAEEAEDSVFAPIQRLKKFVPAWLRRNAVQWSAKLYERALYLGRIAGNIAWIFTTSMLLVGLPVLYAYDREKSLMEQQLASLPTPAPPPAN